MTERFLMIFVVVFRTLSVTIPGLRGFVGVILEMRPVIRHVFFDPIVRNLTDPNQLTDLFAMFRRSRL